VNRLRTTVDIDEELMKRAMRGSGASTKSAAVQMALEFMVRRVEEQETLIRSARGKLRWEGDLTAMRRDRRPSR
jgi:Arc/MetJ family transcription regulator